MKKLDHSYKFLLCLSLVALPWCASAADWVALGLADIGTYGIDRASIEKEGPLRRVWTMLDYREPQKSAQGKTYLSSRALMEMECTKRQVRTRSMALYSGHNLGGEALTSEGIFDQWQSVPPNSPVFTMFKVVCEH
ncbi:MAG: hypothetical protein EBR42_02070 [Betaproteobacteria bacterium]|jgi:hypothetical protein|nr:hypothetical protein [Betaproteobacteria bacterium]